MITLKTARRISHVVLPCAVALFGAQSHAATANSNASVNILTPIAIANAQALTFGDVFPDTAAGSIVLDTAGTRTPTNVTLGATAGAAAAFNVTGEASTAFTINLPASTILTGPGTDMTVDSFTDDAGAALDGTGNASFNVGATLNVGASQTAGAYSGTFTVEAIY